MDVTACNYDASAEQDNGSCTYADPGFNCDGSCASGDLIVLTLSDQYDDGWDYYDGSVSTLTIDGTDYGSDYLSGPPIDISICLDLSGCYDAVFTPANGWAAENSYTITDADGNELAAANAASSIFGSGCVTGCTDETAENYNAESDISDNTLCEYALVQGCTDMAACNYDELAEQDDSSCEYAPEGFNCDGSCASGTFVEYTSGSYAGENQFTISDCDGNELASMSSGYIGFSGCVELTEDYQVSLIDTYGDSWNGGSLAIGDMTYTVGYDDDGGSSFSTVVGSCGIPGCTDESALNFDSEATFDDGSCAYPTFDDVVLPYSATTNNCGSNDFTSTNTSYSGYYLNGEDAGFGFIGSGSFVQVDVTITNGETYTSTIVFDGDPLAGASVVASSEIGWTGGDHSLVFEAVEGTQYVVVTDSWPSPTCYDFDISIMEVVAGCTNPLANNFDLDAQADDGSCVVCIDGEEVPASDLADGDLPDDVITITINAGPPPFAYAGEIHWELYNNLDELVINGGNALTVGNTDAGGFASGDYDDGETYVRTTDCLPDGCYKLITYDTYGDGWNNNGSFSVTNQFGLELVPQTVMGPLAGVDPDGMDIIQFLSN